MNEVQDNSAHLFSTGILSSPDNLLSITQAIPDPLLIISDKGLILDVLGGHTPELYGMIHTFKGRMLQEILPAETATHYLSLIRECLDDRELKTFEFRLSTDALFAASSIRSCAECQWYEARVLPLPKGQGRPDAVIWAIHNITTHKMLIDKLSNQCVRDSLTKLYNRRYFVTVFEKQFDIARRYGQDLSLLILDIDHFKRINDTFGHAAGDAALKGFAAQCTPMFRKADIFARFGGEEFVGLLPNTNIEGAKILAERLCQAVASNIVDVGGLGVEMTVSIGMATLRPEDDTVDEVMSRADQALYKAKERGRNQVCSFSDLEESGEA